MDKLQAIALFSGGLDSILAARMIQEQGIAVQCLHFFSPFFGKPQEIPHWEKTYDLHIEAVDIGQDFVQILRQGPQYGYGKIMNPCTDCKILMMRKAAEYMQAYAPASILISGEVLGQRPMSQRRDSLNVIRKKSGMQDRLLRPLSAKHLVPTPAEMKGLVNRDLLGAISGRGRQQQLALAAKMGITDFPAPAGGCHLDEQENVRRYWSVLHNLDNPQAKDFELANIGRQFWHAQNAWLCIGRNEKDNANLLKLAGVQAAEMPFSPDRFGSETFLFSVQDFPGPFALLRLLQHMSRDAARVLQQEAASLVASYVSKAAGKDTRIAMLRAGTEIPERVCARPARETSFAGNPPFAEIKAALKARKRKLP